MIRFAAFAGVMVVMSGLVLTLFDEARAIDIEYQTAPNTATGQTTYTVNVRVPENTRIPIESVSAFIERGSSNADQKQGATLVTRSTCAFSSIVTSALPAACTNAVLVPGASPALTRDTTLANPNAIHQITFKGFFQGQAATGYEVGYGYVFGNGPLSGVTTGYGYDPVFGYGYGATATPFGPENGYGYGYTEDLFLQFDIVVVGSQLATGTHFLTVGLDTGSPTLGGTLYSPSTEFAAQTVGGGSTTAPPAGNNGDNTVTVPTRTNANPPANAASSHVGTIPAATEGTKVVIQTSDPRINDIELVLGLDASDATVEVTRFTADNPPADVGSLPEGVTVSDFVQVTISVGGDTHVLSFAVEIPESDAGDPNKAVLLKYNPAADRWVPQNRIQLTLSNGVFTGRGESACCSDFAVAFDEQPPTVQLAPLAGALSGVQTLTAEADDNLQLARVDFYFGERLLGADETAPFSWELDTTEFSNGDWTLKAVAHDFVGNSAESMQPATFSNQADDGESGVDGGDGTDGGAAGTNAWMIVLIIAVLVGVVGVAAYFMRQNK